MLLAALALGAASAAERDWAAALRADATAFHADVEANHPGMVNRRDPRFARRNDAAFALAMRRAGLVRDFASYRWAMRGYVAAFDDGHVAFSVDRAPDVALRWPGFLTGYGAAGQHVVVSRADDSPVPLGAALIGCDGRSADAIAQARVGAFFGRWSLRAQRIAEGGRLFIDAGNPFVASPRHCTFRADGVARTVTLAWRALPDAEWSRRMAATGARTVVPAGARTLADGTRWYSMNSFDGDPAGPAAKVLEPMIAGMAADRARLATARAVVLDVRGNGGGSSDWSRRIARVLWGDAALARADAASARTHVEWRVSPAVIAAMDAYRVQFAGDARILAYFSGIAAGLRAAAVAGKPLWREPDALGEAVGAAPASVARGAAAPALRGPVYVVTDATCASACLDAVDLWLAAGAVQVGQETNADTDYLDVRRDPLPSGIGAAVLPMKVYRDRQRGSNVPLAPALRYRFAGDIADTPALERWIATL